MKKISEMHLNELPDLLRPRKVNPYNPNEYSWAFEYWQTQQQIHWIPEEVPLADDVKDWNYKLDEGEKNLLGHIFRFFTQSDVEVGDNYNERYLKVFKPTTVKMMLTAFANMETVHIAAYANLLKTIGMPDTEFAAFMEYSEMSDKHDYMQKFGVETIDDILRTLAMFGAFTEGLQLFASFAILMNFPRHNRMKGMGQIVTWSVRDETLHCLGVIKLFHELAAQTGGLSDSVKEDIRQHCRDVVSMEDRFIDLAFELGPVKGMTKDDIKAYIRFVADWRLDQLGLEPLYQINEHPIPWLQEILNGVEHANFFEARATEYSKAATQGNWTETTDMFRQYLLSKAPAP